jgi:hypothetical protein
MKLFLAIYITGYVLSYIHVHLSGFKKFGHDILLYITLSLFWFVRIPLKMCFLYFDENVPKLTDDDIPKRKYIRTNFKYGK